MDSRPVTEPPSVGLKTLVLLGAGHAHVQVLQQLKTWPAEVFDSLQVILVSPHEKLVYSGMLPGLLAGHYQAHELQVSIGQLIQGTPVQWVKAFCLALHAAGDAILLSNGQELRYDYVSINTGSAMERERMELSLPGARTHAVFVRPIEKFVELWPRLLRFAQEKPHNIAIIGGGAAGVEIALALQHRLAHVRVRVTLVAGRAGVLPAYRKRVRRMAEKALAQAQITVLQDHAQRVDVGVIALESGESLRCDMTWLATGGHAPSWLADSGLALTEQGYVQVNAMQQSCSHPQVFAVGDVATRVDHPHAKSGVFAVRAGAVLARNLLAVVQGRSLESQPIAARTLNLISLGSKRAIMSYGGLTVKGAWVWRWKDSIDRRWMRQLLSRET